MAEVGIENWRAIRREFQRLDPEVRKELDRTVKAAATAIKVEAAALAPMRSGALAKSIKASVTGKGAAVYSTLPYAGIVHWGGTIYPRGVPITFERTEFISRPVERATDRIVDEVGDGIGRAARKVGWVGPT